MSLLFRKRMATRQSFQRVDFENETLIYRQLRKMTRQGKTILIVTHRERYKTLMEKLRLKSKEGFRRNYLRRRRLLHTSNDYYN